MGYSISLFILFNPLPANVCTQYKCVLHAPNLQDHETRRFCGKHKSLCFISNTSRLRENPTTLGMKATSDQALRRHPGQILCSLALLRSIGNMKAKHRKHRKLAGAHALIHQVSNTCDVCQLTHPLCKGWKRQPENRIAIYMQIRTRSRPAAKEAS